MNLYTHDEVDNSVPLKSGIKVIKNNFNKTEPDKPLTPTTIRTICNECDSELELSPSDTHIGWLGAAYVKCPCCGEETMVDELDGITLTMNNIEFPTHFNRTNKNLKDVKEIANEKIIKEIRRGIEYFRKNKDEYHWYTSCGDLFLIIFRYEGDEEYFVVVTRDFYETDISFEREDYND